ncbi:unnamed protein product [Bemisia tabaci]|uniref:Protein ABHD18 n=1 Tax=Bemisia tabaci TaxID=7038 RepID=A0A9P0A970_BEMTA|nr:unnamed protein product [Bemisia tabaci]
MPLSRLDQIYRSVLLSKYFVEGWGKPESLKRLCEFRKIVSNRETCYKLVEPDYPVTITKEESWSDCQVLEGYFISPLVQYLPGIVPPESEKAHFQLILPKTWNRPDFKPVCLHMAGTGDHYYWRRRTILAKPLLKEANIGSIIIENPFYGLRKPKEQLRSILRNVSDIFVMGGCLILESLVLFHWCQNMGLGPLGVTGLSMGGHMASLAATTWPKPIVLVPCLSWSTASGVFTEGVLSNAICWDLLETQYQENESLRIEVQKMLSCIDPNFIAGQIFAKQYNENLIHSDHPMSTVDPVSDFKVTTNLIKDSDLEAASIGLSLSKPELASKVKPSGLSQYLKLQDMKILNTDEYLKVLKSVTDKLAVLSDWKSGKGMSEEQKEALQFMRGIMDEFTHLTQFSTPVDTSLITAVCAIDDGYVPRDGVMDLKDIWPEAKIVYVNAGHVSAFVLHQKTFRQAIIDAYEKARIKYHSS